ncbi:MAG TPA: hypothetical protein VJ885_15530 [Thermoanaerobaculia bacterium]|nr:hypothetical protein [Thermoanaerobaculia bacterium]
MRFDSRDLIAIVTPETDLPAIYACKICDSTAQRPNNPRPCPAPSSPQCQAPSVKPPKNPKKRVAEAEMELSLLRGQLRDSLGRQ